jgi:hypothetical protein
MEAADLAGQNGLTARLYLDANTRTCNHNTQDTSGFLKEETQHILKRYP